MRQRPWFSVLVLAVGLAAGTAMADRLITKQVEPPVVAGKEPAEKETYTIWVGESRLREDRRNRSMIVDRSAGKMYVIKHADKTYYEIDLPIDFESMVPPEMIVQWRTVLKAGQPKITIEPSSETGTVRGHDVKKWVAVVTSPAGTSTTMTLWTTLDPGFDVEEYKALMQEILALQPNSAEWIRELYDTVEGYPVRMLRSASTPDGEKVWTEEMISVEEKTAPQGAWLPAEGYTEVEFNLLSATPE